MSRPTPRIELVWASPEDREAVLSVAGVSVTLTADELADLIGEAEHVHDLLTCDLALLIETDRAAEAHDAAADGGWIVSLYYSDDLVTLHLGDCLTETAWLGADVLVTDPPYGMGYQSNWRRNKLDKVLGDHDTAARDSALALWGGALLWYGLADQVKGRRPGH